MPFPVIARRRYGYCVAPFVTRKNGTLGRRAVGHGGGWGNPITSEESRRQSGDPTVVANHRHRRSDRARDRFTL